MKNRKSSLVVFFMLLIVTCFGQSFSPGFNVGVSGAWTTASLVDTVGYLKTDGSYFYAAPSVYYYLNDETSLSFETQLALGQHDNNPFQWIPRNTDDAFAAKTLMMLRLNLFSASNTWEDTGLALGTCRVFRRYYDCWIMGFTVGIGREWTSGMRFRELRTERFVSYPVELGVTINVFHPSTALGIAYRFDIDNQPTSTDTFSLTFTYSFLEYLY